MWHYSAHLMAEALEALYPGIKLAIGPAIENGFYYDFARSEPFSTEDLEAIEIKMREIIDRDDIFTREVWDRAEAVRTFRDMGEDYKAEIIEGLPEDDEVKIYRQGEWFDLCRGPHLPSTGRIGKAFKLMKVAGAYWRGDSNRPMLQRIYGTAWENAEQLQAYNDFKAEAKRRDHRTIGQDLSLFSLQQDNAGGGLVFWHPKGAYMRHMIETYWKDLHLARGYELLYSPHVAKQELWKTSGHSDFYSENMYQPIKVEEEMYQLKPMNCPFHIVVYQDGYYSYKDLPIRWAELGTVYRYERSGTMHGLFRVRGFTQDDAHIFCLPDQITSEIKGVLDLTEEILSTFGFKDFEVNLSTRPEKSVGDDSIWDTAESALKDALTLKGWDYIVDDGGGAFYGPKIDIKILDAIGRKWQCSTVQLDFNLPERFDLSYVDRDNVKQRPIMIHRAIFGSLERFFGILTENYAGEFPLCLAPEQVRLLPVTDEVSDYTEGVAKKLRDAGVRVEICSGQRLAKLVRTAEKSKIPVMAVVGREEAENNTLAVRTYKDGDVGSLSVDEVLSRIVTANATKGDNF